MRISKNEYYLKIAEAVALRSTCLRRQYGAVIVNNDEIIATGYNGSCKAVHAEQNAIISASRRDMQGATLYLASLDKTIEPTPCNICDRMIKNAGITRVVTCADTV